MRFFFLGGGADLLPLLRAIQHHHSVLGWCDCSPIERQLREMFPGGVAFEQLEQARIDSSTVVAAGMGGDLETHEARLRELARDGIPMVLVQPPCSAIFAMELDMIQRDTGAAMIPLHPESLHPAIAWLEGWTKAESPVGTIQQIVIERTAHDRQDAAVQSMLARDALLFRRLLGDFQQVGAMQAGEDKSLSNLSVHLTGSGPALARWSVGPVLDQPGVVLSIVGDRGKISVNMPDGDAWTVSTAGFELTTAPGLNFDVNTAIREQIEEGLEGAALPPTWEDAVRCMDLADVASESVRRGKTLPVHNEQLTEEDTFKSMMAAGGCLILLILPLVLLLVTLIDGLRIPISKHSTILARGGERTVYLPTDVRTLHDVYLATGEELNELTPQSLSDTYGAARGGRPAAFSISEGRISLAPVPDDDYELTVHYQGSFSIGHWWPLLLLLPIVFFLLLQLFKLVFPRRPAVLRLQD